MSLCSRAVLLLFAVCAANVNAGERTVVRVTTNYGAFDIALLDDLTPLSVANMLAYVNASDYDGTFFHRVPHVAGGAPFVVQGGNFKIDDGGTVVTVTSRGTVNNEPRISNVRGTVALAKVGGNPDSATNQWFVNMGDNSANLDNQNGGFTVFGSVLGDGMQVLDTIGALRTVNAGGAFTDLPISDDYPGGAILPVYLVTVSTAAVVTVAEGFAVPALAGTTEAAAEQALVLAGHQLGAISGVVDASAPACTVVSQSVAAGTDSPVGTMVDVALASTADVSAFSVPNVVELDQAQAQAALVGAGLRLGSVTSGESEAAAGTVLSQSVAVDTATRCGAPIDIVVSAGATDPAAIVPLILDLLSDD